MELPKSFGNVINDQLAKLDRSASWLAQKLQVSQGSVSRWINDHTRPRTPELVGRIADALAIHNPAERASLFQLAGYGYQELAKNKALPVATISTTPITESHNQVSQEHTNTEAMWTFTVPQLPVHGIFGRAQFLNELIDKLQANDPNATNIPPIALQGMGGIGKTTLAIALGRNENISRSFPDGVLWSSVGPKPTLRILLEDWGRALKINMYGERDENSCAERLRTLLHKRRVLLIVDDLWEVAHGQYFTVAGPRCRTLITTRELPVAYTLAGRNRTLSVDLLKPEDAFALLAQLAPDAVVADPKSAQLICERLEYLPLALTLVGRLLANEAEVPSRMQRLLAELIEHRNARLHLHQAEGRIGLDNQNPVSLHAILGMSVNRLAPIDQERFAMLAVFGGEPLTWDIEAATYVWECSQADAEITVSNFVQRGLVTRRQSKYWTHALLVDFAAEMMKEMGL